MKKIILCTSLFVLWGGSAQAVSFTNKTGDDATITINIGKLSPIVVYLEKNRSTTPEFNKEMLAKMNEHKSNSIAITVKTLNLPTSSCVSQTSVAAVINKTVTFTGGQPLCVLN